MLLRHSVTKTCLAVCAAAAAMQLVTLLLPRFPAAVPEQTSLLTVHLLLELFAVAISVLVVTVSWHTFDARQSHPASILISGFVVVAACDVAHALTYEGMPAFLGNSGTDRAIFFWLMGRTAEVATLGLIAVGWMPRTSRGTSLTAGAAISALLIWFGSYRLSLFPETFVTGTGVTPFKGSYEVSLCVLNLLIAGSLWRNAKRSGESRLYLLATSVWVIGIGELSFTGYVSPSDFLNIFGHVYKIFGYTLLYQATYIASIRAPFQALSDSERRANESESRIRKLSDNLPNSIVYQVVREPDGAMRFLYISDGVEKLMGVSVADALRDYNALFHNMHPDDRPAILQARQRSSEQMNTFDAELRHYLPDGRIRWFHFVSSPRWLADGRLGWDGVATDVTERRAAEEVRRENEAMLDAVVETAGDAIISTDDSGHITLFNPAAERIFGYPASSMLGQSLERILPDGVQSQHRPEENAVDAGDSRRMIAGRVRGLRADGTELALEASISQFKVQEKGVFNAILRDVSDRVRTEHAIVQYQHELTELTQRLMAQEKETTRRLAQALHDQLGQTLTAMRIDFVSDADFTDPAKVSRHARVDMLINQAIREVRHVLMELRPTLLDERGLVEALDNELRMPRIATEGVRMQLDVPAEIAARRWHADVEYAVFMVAREAIANALRHARASLVRVALRAGQDGLRLEVTDNGVGFNPRAVSTRPGHLGMVGMRERSIAIGAQFEVGSRPGSGTTVSLTWQAADA